MFTKLQIENIIQKSTATCYEVLGVTPDADFDTIKKAYRAKSLVVHPDKSSEPDSKEKFQCIVQAYEVLGNKPSRFIYDSILAFANQGIPETETKSAAPFFNAAPVYQPTYTYQAPPHVPRAAPRSEPKAPPAKRRRPAFVPPPMPNPNAPGFDLITKSEDLLKKSIHREKEFTLHSTIDEARTYYYKNAFSRDSFYAVNISVQEAFHKLVTMADKRDKGIPEDTREQRKWAIQNSVYNLQYASMPTVQHLSLQGFFRKITKEDPTKSILHAVSDAPTNS